MARIRTEPPGGVRGLAIGRRWPASAALSPGVPREMPCQMASMAEASLSEGLGLLLDWFWTAAFVAFWIAFV